MSNLEINRTVEETIYLSPEQLGICQMKANAKMINDIYLKYHENEQVQLSAIKWSPQLEVLNGLIMSKLEVISLTSRQWILIGLKKR